MQRDQNINVVLTMSTENPHCRLTACVRMTE